MKHLFWPAFACFISVLASRISGCETCELIYTFQGEWFLNRMGAAVSSAGDVNNDGVGDIIIGAPAYAGPIGLRGNVYVYSGRNGDTLHHYVGNVDIDRFGFAVSTAGDVNADGYDDFMIGTLHGNGFVVVYSGMSGEAIYTYEGPELGAELGYSIASLGDIDKDGYDDFVLGAHAISKAYVFSGKLGDTLYTFLGEHINHNFGISVSSAGDINLDGYGDILIGASGAGNGKVYLYSGFDGSMLHIFNSPAQYGFGNCVANAGDINKDGIADIIIGAPNFAFGGKVFVYSGLDWTLIRSFQGEESGALFGKSVAGLGDINSDGMMDIIIGAHEMDGVGENSGRAYVFTPETGETLHIFEDEFAHDNLGHSVASIGDVNGDGIGEILLGAFGFYGSTGKAYVISGLGCLCFRGDVNNDGSDANILDLTYLVNYLFRNGLPSPCNLDADVNNDGVAENILDLTFMIDYIFRNGTGLIPCRVFGSSKAIP